MVLIVFMRCEKQTKQFIASGLINNDKGNPFYQTRAQRQ